MRLAALNLFRQPRGCGEKPFNTLGPMNRDGMPRNRDTGFHSAAGLIRYFDQEDEKAIKLPPWLVVAFAIALGAAVVLASVYWPV